MALLLRSLGISLVACWSLSLVLASPQLFVFSLQTADHETGEQDCWAHFGGSKTFEKVKK